MPRERNATTPVALPLPTRLGRTFARGATVVAVLSLAAACNGSSEAATAGTDGAAAAAAGAMTLGPEDVAVAQTTELGSGVTLRGSLEPAQTVTVRSQVAGTVRNLRVDRGSAVRRGQVPCGFAVAA